jgi:hypothetical protein
MTSKEFIDTVNDEFDIETLELMQELIDKRLILIKNYGRMLPIKKNKRI